MKIVDAQSPAPGTKPAWAGKGTKTPVKDVIGPSNPAPTAKLPKPSPARNVQPSSEANEAGTPVLVGQGQDQSTKRKLNLDVQTGGVTEVVTNPPSVDTSDSGVKVRRLQGTYCMQDEYNSNL